MGIYNLDYQPGQSEVVTGQEIEAIAINTPTFFEIEPGEPWPFILADVSITNGTTTLIRGTDYTLIPNTKYTAREAVNGYSGKTIYSGLTIINATYAGIPLYITALNFGTYTSNNSVREYIDERIGGETKVLWTGPLSVVGVTASLDTGEKFSDWDMIDVEFNMNSDANLFFTTPISMSIVEATIRSWGNSGYITFQKLSDTTFQINGKTVASGNISRIIGIKL